MNARQKVFQKKTSGKVSQAVKNYVKRAIGSRIEDKQSLTAPGAPAFAIGDTLTTFSVNEIAQGSGDNERIGKNIRMKQLNIKGYLEPSAANPTADVMVRVLIFIDRQANGGVPDLDSLFAGLTGVPPEQFNAPINLAGKQRYRILRDFNIMCHVAGGSSNIGHRVPINWKIPMRGLKTSFRSPGGLTADIETNTVWVGYVSENNNAWSVRTCEEIIYEDA